MSLFSTELVERIHKARVMAVLVVDRAEDGVPLAEALLCGGVNAMELTLRTTAAIDVLKVVRAKVPEMLVGVGTVLTREQVKQGADAGAAFGMAPGLNPKVLEEAARSGLPFAPGVATPSDIEAALELGCQELKFFPAEPIGGIRYLRTLASPYTHRKLRYIPLGGINVDNARDYLADPLVLAVGGSWIASQTLIQQRDWKTITQRAAEASRIIAECEKVSWASGS